MSKDLNNKANMVMANANLLPDEHSHGVYKMLMDVYPNFAKKLFENNTFMKKIVMSGMNPMQILDYPICGKCETLALYDGYAKRNGKYVNRCTCVAEGCGASTADPITLRTWIAMELKHKAPAEYIEMIEYAVDDIVHTMIEKYYKDNAGVLQAHNAEASKKMGVIYDQYGTPIAESDDKPTIVHGYTNPNIKLDVEL